jgi:phosphohistidine swiveling domain-containing protein
MSSSKAESALHFEAPGPGSWKLDPVHFPRPVTRYWTEMHPAAFARGVGDFTSFYGMLLDTLEAGYVNQFAYLAMRPVSEEQVPARLARAEQVIDQKLWRSQLREWDETVKPAAIKAHRELLGIDPDRLSDDDLIAYLARCRDHHSAMISQHMRYTAAALVPTGDFLAHVGDWADVSPAELLGLLRGTAPVSAGASDELENLINAIRNDPIAQKLLSDDNDGDNDPGDPGSVFNQLRELESATGAAMSAYLGLVGYRLLDGFDIAEPCAIELPDVLLRAIRVAVEGQTSKASDVESKIDAVRNKLSAEYRGQFDELLGEARLTYRIRDERGVFSDIWASGIMRRAALAAGRRLADQGRIEKAEHFLDAGFEEMRALLSDSDEPAAQVLSKRAAYRAAHRAREAPMTLGPPPPEPPDLSKLPPAAARIMRATDIALGSLFDSSQAKHEVDMLRGLAASRGVYEGPARRVSGPAEFDRILSGDILVTESTTEAFNLLLPLLGAIVTDSGGLLSHSAIVAREYGIPGVVGTRDATERIADGVKLRVDGDKGEVTVLG